MARQHGECSKRKHAQRAGKGLLGTGWANDRWFVGIVGLVVLVSVVVWDGHTLAADKQATCVGLRLRCTKLYTTESGNVFAFTGDLLHINALMQWVRRGFEPADYPAFQNTDDWTRMVSVGPRGPLYEYGKGTPVPIEHDANEPMAFGSGRDFAIGALAMGADAIKAVEIASTFCVDCGMGIDSFKVR